MTNDLEIQTGSDFDMDTVDDMPQFVNEIDGVYKCSLSLKRETESKNDKDTDNIMMLFVIEEAVEEKKDHGINNGDMVSIRYSLIKSKKDIEDRRKESFGLRLAKPILATLKEALGTGSSLNEIIQESQDVKCTVTFSTRYSDVTKDGEKITYANPQVKKLIVA